MVKKAGLAGEEHNALITYIVCISRFCAKPLSLFIKGRSSSGKNFLANMVFLLIPKRHVFEISSATESAWNYQNRRLAHKIVYEQEIIGTQGSMSKSRLLLSEGRLIRWITVWKKGKRITKKQVTEGPIASISTSTKNRLLVDDESRRLSIWIDETQEQTKRILDRQLDDSDGLSKEEIKIWHDIQYLIAERAETRIRLPKWRRELVEYISAHDVRARRYLPAFLQALKTVCLIRSFRKNNIQGPMQETLRVGFADFAITTIIFEKAFTDSMTNGEEHDQEIRTCVEAISVRNKVKYASIIEVAQTLGITYHVARRRIQQAENRGIITAVSSHPRRNNAKGYIATPKSSFLPDPAEIFQKVNHGSERVRFRHPVTGKRIIYEKACK